MITERQLDALTLAALELLQNTWDAETDRDENGHIYRDIAGLTVAYADVVDGHMLDMDYVRECELRLTDDFTD